MTYDNAERIEEKYKDFSDLLKILIIKYITMLIVTWAIKLMNK
tara:strand:- start:39 stop:167 length:129 start_codon:yes stop_codon:yes gene_type:complete